MADVRLVNRYTNSVVTVDESKADSLRILGFDAEKAPAKKAAAKRSSSNSEK